MPHFVSDGHQGGDPCPAVAANPASLRAAPRHSLLIRSAKLIIQEAEYLCILRDASDTGVSLKLFHEVPPATFMVLEMQNADRHEVELIWQDNERMGLRFVQPTKVARIIEMPEPYPRRPIRMRVNVPGMVSVGLENAICTIRDLSQHGAKISCSRSFAIEQRIGLVTDGIPRVIGKVRWRRNEQFGLAFETTFQLGELANIVAALQGTASAIQPHSIPMG